MLSKFVYLQQPASKCCITATFSFYLVLVSVFCNARLSRWIHLIQTCNFSFIMFNGRWKSRCCITAIFVFFPTSISSSLVCSSSLKLLLFNFCSVSLCLQFCSMEPLLFFTRTWHRFRANTQFIKSPILCKIHYAKLTSPMSNNMSLYCH